MPAPRAGSRKSEVYEAFLASGAEAAAAKGKALELADATVKSWVAAWAKHDPAEARVEGNLDAYQCMLIHYEAISNWRKKNPTSRSLPDHLDELDDEIREICKEKGWQYPGAGM